MKILRAFCANKVIDKKILYLIFFALVSAYNRFLYNLNKEISENLFYLRHDSILRLQDFEPRNPEDAGSSRVRGKTNFH